TSDHRDRLPRNEFAHKDDSPPPLINVFSAHIKTQIHFFEITVPWDGQAENARVQEKESNDAQESSSPMKIKLCPARQQRFQEFWIGHEIQHREVAPIRGEKRFEHGLRMKERPSPKRHPSAVFDVKDSAAVA